MECARVELASPQVPRADFLRANTHAPLRIYRGDFLRDPSRELILQADLTLLFTALCLNAMVLWLNPVRLGELFNSLIM